MIGKLRAVRVVVNVISGRRNYAEQGDVYKRQLSMTDFQMLQQMRQTSKRVARKERRTAQVSYRARNSVSGFGANGRDVQVEGGRKIV